jgi:hypothetical protein
LAIVAFVQEQVALAKLYSKVLAVAAAANCPLGSELRMDVPAKISTVGMSDTALAKHATISKAMETMWNTKIAKATIALSEMPTKFNTAATAIVTAVITSTSNSAQFPHNVCRYRIAEVAEITAVVTYDSMVKHAAMLAFVFVVVLSSKLYVPPFTGRAVTTSSYILRKR